MNDKVLQYWIYEAYSWKQMDHYFLNMCNAKHVFQNASRTCKRKIHYIRMLWPRVHQDRSSWWDLSQISDLTSIVILKEVESVIEFESENLKHVFGGHGACLTNVRQIYYYPSSSSCIMAHKTKQARQNFVWQSNMHLTRKYTTRK